MKNYILTRKAEEDIREIWNYTAEEWDKEQAENYLSGLEDKIIRASETPEAIARDRTEIEDGYMSFLYESHVVFFKRKLDQIEVIRVLHQRMDIPKRLR